MTLARWIAVLRVERIGLSTQMREHVMAATDGALMSQRRNVYWRHDDAFTWPRAGLRQNASIVINHLTASGPGVRWIMPQACALVGGS